MRAGLLQSAAMGEHRDDGLLSTLDPPVSGVVFDYGNTLIPFGQREVDLIGEALARFLVAEIPGTAPEAAAGALKATWVGLHREREATMKESDPRDVIRRSFRLLGAEADEDGHVERGIAASLAAFIAAVGLAEGTVAVLESLKERGLGIALLSNYSLGAAIHDSIAALGIRPYFDAVIVSSELGLVKPHRDLFLAAAEALDLPPADILFVGDNMAADIAGSKAVGMRAAHITEHLHGAYFFEHPDETAAEVEPDLVLRRLTDLTHGG